MEGHIYPSQQTAPFLFLHTGSPGLRSYMQCIIGMVAACLLAPGPLQTFLGQISWEVGLFALGYYIHSLIEDALV